MSFMNRTKNKLNEMSSDTERKTRGINGRLYADTGRDNIYHVVPRGMDDARDLKTHPVPDYVISDDKEYQIVNSKAYMDNLRKGGAKTFSADKADRFAALEAVEYTPQDFVQVDEPVAIMCSSVDGKSIPQLLEPGDYLTMSSEDNIYGVSAEEFDSTYVVLGDKTISSDREIPEIGNMSDDSLESEMDDMQV